MFGRRVRTANGSQRDPELRRKPTLRWKLIPRPQPPCIDCVGDGLDDRRIFDSFRGWFDVNERFVCLVVQKLKETENRKREIKKIDKQVIYHME